MSGISALQQMFSGTNHLMKKKCALSGKLPPEPFKNKTRQTMRNQVFEKRKKNIEKPIKQIQ